MTNKDETHEYKLLNTAFNNNLSMPTVNMINRQIFLQKPCSEIQSKNNLCFLGKVEVAICDYVYHAQLDYKTDNNFDNSFDCECNYDCRCSLNIFAISAFKNIHRQFTLDIGTNPLLNEVLREHTIEEQDRLLGYDLVEVFRVILHRQLAILAYDMGFYHISCKQHELAVLIYGGLNIANRIDADQYLEASEVLARNYKKIGSKGGSQKGINYSEPKQKALSYHDKYLSDKNEKGRFIYSNDKAAREIISYFESKSESLGYAERSLSNIIRKHRNRQTTD